jgi:hypothetical protein
LFCALMNGASPSVRAIQDASVTCQPAKFDEPT